MTFESELSDILNEENEEKVEPRICELAKITVEPSPTADSRTAGGAVTKQELLRSSKQHIGDVQGLMGNVCAYLKESCANHDWTKVEFIDYFCENFNGVIEDDSMKFCDMEWYKIHERAERHHLNEKNHSDLDLLDVIESLIDGVMAGKARSGNYIMPEMTNEFLQKALKNTAKKLCDSVEIKKEK